MTNNARTAQELADDICRGVSELPDRSSPEDWPEAMLVTQDELRRIVLAALASQAEPVARQQTRQVQAACVEFDGRSRLRGPVRGSSERFHAIAEHGGFACDQFNLAPGEPVPAANVSPGLRCARKACARLFGIADAAATPPATAQAEPTMSDAIAAGDGTLHGAIDYWQQRALKAEQSEDGRDAELLDALGDYLEKQDALDNREISGPNAEDYFVLVSRRNKARSFLDAAIAAKEQS